MNNPIDYDNNSQELLRQFIKQLNEGGMDKDPTIASQDLKYIRGLQRARLARHGVKLQKTYGKAKKDIDMAFELEPNSPDCYLTRASLYLAMKKKRLAQQDCKTAIRLGATPEQVASILGALK